MEGSKRGEEWEGGRGSRGKYGSKEKARYEVIDGIVGREKWWACLRRPERLERIGGKMGKRTCKDYRQFSNVRLFAHSLSTASANADLLSYAAHTCVNYWIKFITQLNLLLMTNLIHCAGKWLNVPQLRCNVKCWLFSFTLLMRTGLFWLLL